MAYKPKIQRNSNQQYKRYVRGELGMNSENTESNVKYISEKIFENPGKTSILRCCTLLLAAVSFYATAQGMIEYVFAEEWQAYAASFAIQGMLVALNFYLPARMKKVKKLVSKMAVILMVAIVTFCSSWFSYVYIAGKMFKDSWEEKGHLTLEKEYRTQLYKTQDYLNGYIEELNNELSVSIQDLYTSIEKMQAAKEISTSLYDWDAEMDSLSSTLKTAYAQEDTIYVNISKELERMIDSIKSWENDPNNTNKQEAALTSVRDEIEQIDDRRKQAEDSLKEIKESITDYEEKIQTQEEERRTNARRGLDYAQNTEEENRLSQKKQDAESKRNNLEAIIDAYKEIATQLKSYEKDIEKEEKNNTNALISDVREIQDQLFEQEPDATQLVKLSADIYSRLREEEGNNTSGQYTEALNKMQTFSRQLTTYAKLKEAQAQVEGFLENRDTGDNANSDITWEEQWNTNINGLKTVISRLPVYSIKSDEEKADWMQYNRATVVADMETVQERYINQHNAAEQGLIYLKSPYWYLAAFSLMLAIFFDVAGFITGVFIEIEESKKAKEPHTEEKNAEKSKEKIVEESSSFSQLFEKRAKVQLHNQYYILTGDYNHVDKEDIYIAYDCDKRVSIKQREGLLLKQGVYVMRENSEQLEKAVPQEVCFAVDPKEARDGVYAESKFHYKDQMLWTEDKQGNSNYVTNVDKNVLVYSLEKDELHKDAVGRLDMEDYGCVTLALNKEGTKVAAIYIVYDITEDKTTGKPGTK